MVLLMEEADEGMHSHGGDGGHGGQHYTSVLNAKCSGAKWNSKCRTSVDVRPLPRKVHVQELVKARACCDIPSFLSIMECVVCTPKSTFFQFLPSVHLLFIGKV